MPQSLFVYTLLYFIFKCLVNNKQRQHLHTPNSLIDQYFMKEHKVLVHGSRNNVTQSSNQSIIIEFHQDEHKGTFIL